VSSIREGGSQRHGPISKLAADDDPETLGKQLVETLLLSSNNYPYDREKLMKDKDRALVALADLKNETTFHRTAHQVSVSHFLDRILFVPNKTKGSTYYGNKEDRFNLAVESSHIELGEAIVKGFTLTKPYGT